MTSKENSTAENSNKLNDYRYGVIVGSSELLELELFVNDCAISFSGFDVTIVVFFISVQL